MRSFTSAALLGLSVTSALVSAAPFKFPLQNGFPNPNADELHGIEEQAGGLLPNGPPPPSVSADGITNFKLIAFNELFEVAFFTELLFNITNKVHGYEATAGMQQDFLIDAIKTILAVSKTLLFFFFFKKKKREHLADIQTARRAPCSQRQWRPLSLWRPANPALPLQLPSR
jgi:hypothetical protein